VYPAEVSEHAPERNRSDPANAAAGISDPQAELAAGSFGEVLPLNIVMLDDDEDFREFLGGLLTGVGHMVRSVADPAAFYAACEQELPDVVLLDMNMGRASGGEVLGELRRRWAKLCVIVITGYPSLETMRTTFKQDVFDYIAKPFSSDVLFKALDQATQSLGLGQRPQDRLRLVLGQQIRLARGQQRWTLRDLSDACGTSVSQLSSIERGAHLPSLESLVAIATALNQTPSDWLKHAGF